MAHTISLTDFIDFVHSSGTARATMARSMLDREEYQPYQDYYKQLRERIIKTHEDGRNKTYLKNILSSVPEFKHDNYKIIADQYCSWWGYKKPVWFEPPRSKYTQSGIAVSLNPELGLTLNGADHIIKLYFKAPKLSKQKANLALGVMEMKFKQYDAIPSILDIRRKKLFRPTVNIPGLKQAVDAELAYLSVFLP